MYKLLTLTWLFILCPLSFASIQWQECPAQWGIDTSDPDNDNVQCAYVSTPIDHNQQNPDEFAQLALTKLPATGDKKGSLIVLAGGPGQPGINPSFAQSSHDVRLRESFDIIGYDPRGIGASTPKLECDDPAKLSDKTAMQAWVTSCQQKTNPLLLKNLSTMAVVEDLEILRKALNEPQLNLLAYSYGTAPAQLYALKYPEHVRAIVLDGVVDLTENHEIMTLNQERGFNLAFLKFAIYCAEEGSCPLSARPEDAKEQLIQLLQKADHGKIKNREGDSISADDIMNVTESALYWDTEWDDLIAFLQSAKKGQLNKSSQSMLDALEEDDTDMPVFIAINCTDYGKNPLATSFILENNFTAILGHHQEAEVCNYWPISNPVFPVLNIKKPDHLPPLLFIAQTGDPTTPYANATRMSALFHSPLITKYSNGHTFVLLNDDECVNSKVVDYILDPGTQSHDDYCM